MKWWRPGPRLDTGTVGVRPSSRFDRSKSDGQTLQIASIVMNESTPRMTSRREFLKDAGSLVAASTLAGTSLPSVHAAENNTIQVALIGCGGRGTGAAENAMSVQNGPIKLVAMADVFENRLRSSFKGLSSRFADKMDVSEERKFIGLDAYQKAMDCLKPGDVVIFAT